MFWIDSRPHNHDVYPSFWDSQAILTSDFAMKPTWIYRGSIGGYMDRYDQFLQTQLFHKTIILKASGALRLHMDLGIYLSLHSGGPKSHPWADL